MSIDYNLAKRLKEAGFPQKLNLLVSADDLMEIEYRRDAVLKMQRDYGYHHTFDSSILGYPETEPDFFEQGKWRYSNIFSRGYLESEEGRMFTIYFPTLPELIEACGIGFFELRRESFEWQVRGKGENGWIYGGGSTPEEAVANLWLELNKK